MACRCLYRGTGSVRGLALDSDGVPITGKWFEMSQSSTFATTPATEEVDYPDYDGISGGSCDTEERITNIALAMTMHSYCTQTLAANLGAEIVDRAGAAITDEPHKAFKGSLIPFARLPDMSEDVVVTDDGGGAIAATEYDRTDRGIIFKSTAATADDTDILVDYTSATTKVIEAFKSTGNLYRILFPSANAVGLKGRWNLLLHRVKFSVASEQPWKSTDAPSFALAGRVLKDPSILESSTQSPYMSIETDEV